ncbi:hypothetical protein KM1_237870, partial [Entamoeba histolytica HM-3:IMSS]
SMKIYLVEYRSGDAFLKPNSITFD